MRKNLLKALAGVVVLGVLIQFVPYGRNHTNPPVTAEPKWASQQTQDLAVRACYDCHSNQTEWPWYSNVAPASWLIQHDVDEGRSKLNFTHWDQPQREARDASRQVERGTMPQWYYVILHPAASLTTDEKQALIQGLRNLNTPGG